ncbi:hypothetical protein BLNAU_23235 [Blattamonas nauphoetae]|uniref:Uncharacterized protein n=1 Tax=Blattamonas nauphoetae TaxID=2049346 RepID=A0ABQ9WRY0_9EUKA|nr:hypothetical protein BLNAU_23235 [Blattamonas nauphoetae]
MPAELFPSPLQLVLHNPFSFKTDVRKLLSGSPFRVLHQHRAMTLVQTTNYRFPACIKTINRFLKISNKVIQLNQSSFNVDYYAVTDCCTTKIERLLRQPTGLDDGGTGFGLTNGTDLNVTNTNVIKM